MSDNALITNQDKFMAQVFSKILPSSGNLFFLVGYFYFSGFEALYKHLADKQLNILVGMDIELTLQNKVSEFVLMESIEISRGAIRDNFYSSFVHLCNDTTFFDNPERLAAFSLYLEKIRNGSLCIKKTLYPNHAKLYLFENLPSHSQDDEFPGTVITGSSNLTIQGLRERREVNVILRDPRDYREAREVFDSLWNTAIDIATPDSLPYFFEKVIRKTWMMNSDTLKPFWLYARVLDELFFPKAEKRLRFPADITKQRYFDLKYQTDAIHQAINTIRRHDGVIISDVVGLGKSIIASVTACNLGLKTIIISPPHLVEQWETFRRDFDFNAKVFSGGLLEKALAERIDHDEVLLIVDEAHKYRNENTESYALLHRLCQNAKVILLTATPYSNRPQDILSLIKLFQLPAKSTIRTVENLSLEFKSLIEEYKNIEKIRQSSPKSEEEIQHRIRALASRIRDILFPLIIRRTRLDLEAINSYRADLGTQGIVFPRVLDPIALEYPLGDLAPLYLNTLRKIDPGAASGGFTGARYKPVSYLKNIDKYRNDISAEFGDDRLFTQSQENMAKMMRRLLVARFESSVAAFRKTLETMIHSSRVMLNWIDKAQLAPIYKRGGIPDVEELFNSNSDSFSAAPGFDDPDFSDNLDKLREKGFEFVPAHELKVAFRRDLLRDINLLEEIRENWFSGNAIPHDPKLDHFAAIAAAMLQKEPRRKLAVYSQYADTVHYLHLRLKETLRVFRYTSADASSENKRIIRENFDAGWETQKDEYDILIATDAIAEGYNLHRAGAVFNYDIPYNPTRVIQRVGRINRINKKMFDELYIYNFFPTDIGEREVRTKQISTLKKTMINALLGEDTRVLTAEEELNTYFTEKIREELTRQEELSWDTPYRVYYENLRQNQPEVLEQARRLPHRGRVRRIVNKDVSGVLVFGKKGDDFIFRFGDHPLMARTIETRQGLELFSAEVPEKGFTVSSGFYDVYGYVRDTLFSKRFGVTLDKTKYEAVRKLKTLIKKMPHKKDYLEDTLQALEKLDALPERYVRRILRLSFSAIEQEFAILEAAMPHRYLADILAKAAKVNDGDEYIIFAEEFKKNDPVASGGHSDGE